MKREHETVDGLLPWFVNGSLGDRQHRRVLAHLRECNECRSERDRLQEIETFIHEDGLDGVPDYRPAFDRLMNRIEAHEANLQSTREVARDRGWRLALPYSAVAACLVASVAFVIALNPGDEPRQGDFRTLTAPAPATGVATARLALTFDAAADSELVRSVLIRTDATLVSGPDESGTYIVALQVAEGTTGHELLETLRAHEGVRDVSFVASRTDR